LYGPVDAAGGSARLDNMRITPPPPSARRERRYALRALLWEFSQVKRCKGCGRWMTGTIAGVRHSESNGAGFSGIQSCGSVWVCPVCSAKIMARRSVETGVLLLGWENRGGRLVFGTLTMRHNRGHSLVQEWDALQAAWNSVLRSRVWSKWKKRLGSPGLVKVVEVTYGWDNGWHVHIHFVLLVDATVTAADEAELALWLFPKWHRALVAQGMPGAQAVGQKLELIESVEAATRMGEYFTKGTAYGSPESLGRELFSSWSKSARGVHSTEPVWRLIEEFAATGDLALLALWHEMERVSRGRKQMNVSQGLRELMHMEPEKSDEEIAAEEAGDRDLVQISREGWQQVLASPWPASRILDVMEGEGVDGVCRFLEAEGIEHWEVQNDGKESER
jgi:Replication protein